MKQKFKFQQCAQSAQSRHMCCSRSTQSIPGHKKYIIDIDDRNSFLQSLQKNLEKLEVKLEPWGKDFYQEENIHELYIIRRN